MELSGRRPAIDQRHRARMWATYDVPMSVDAGAITLGLLQQFASGVPYAPLMGRQRPPERSRIPVTSRRCRRLNTSRWAGIHFARNQPIARICR